MTNRINSVHGHVAPSALMHKNLAMLVDCILPWMRGPGWRPLISSGDFGEWNAVLANTIGHHRSRLLAGSNPFKAQICTSGVDDFQVISLHGSGRLELQREQCGNGVL